MVRKWRSFRTAILIFPTDAVISMQKIPTTILASKQPNVSDKNILKIQDFIKFYRAILSLSLMGPLGPNFQEKTNRKLNSRRRIYPAWCSC